jgi:lipoprotein signal peptidase
MTSASRSGWPLAILAVAVLAADQASKLAVARFTEIGSLRILIPGLLNVVHTATGVAFGFFAIQPRLGAPAIDRFLFGVLALIVWLLATDPAAPGSAGMAWR